MIKIPPDVVIAGPKHGSKSAPVIVAAVPVKWYDVGVCGPVTT